MRETDHDDLRNLLPPFLQLAVPLAANRPDSLPWAPNRGQIIRMKTDAVPSNVMAIGLRVYRIKSA